jgi:hypothetical protein
MQREVGSVHCPADICKNRVVNRATPQFRAKLTIIYLWSRLVNRFVIYVPKQTIQDFGQQNIAYHQLKQAYLYCLFHN